MRILMLFACRKKNVFDSSRDKETAPAYVCYGYYPHLTIHLPCLWAYLGTFLLGALLLLPFPSRCSHCFIDFIMDSENWSETMRINANLLRMCMHKRNLSIHCVQVIWLLAKEKIQLKLFCVQRIHPLTLPPHIASSRTFSSIVCGCGFFRRWRCMQRTIYLRTD